MNTEGTILKGVKVVELSHFLSAQITGMLLAEQGADVVQIINPNEINGDPVLDAVLGRGKTQITLDLKNNENISKLKELLSHADIFIENYAPGTLKKLGINIDQIRETVNSKLINCSIPAFPTGDSRSESIGYESIAGMAGMLYEKPFNDPFYFDIPMGSMLGGIYASIGLISALISRNRDGYGQYVEASLYGSNIFAEVLQVLVLTGAPRMFFPFKMLGTPFMGVWKCLDNRYIYVHITQPIHNAKMIDLLEKEGYIEDIKELRGIMSPGTIKDPTLVKNIKEAQGIKRVMQRIYGTRNADDWERLFGSDLCCIKVRYFNEWAEDSIKAGMDDVIKIDDPIFGNLNIPGPAITFSDAASVLTPRKIDSTQISDILNSWKKDQPKNPLNKLKVSSESESQRLPPLHGVKVLDLSRIIAGPFSARILAELGADVLSIQSPTNLDWALTFHVVFNAGKRSVTLDLAKEEEKAQFWTLLEKFQPNVFIQNYRNLDLSKQIGVDYESIKSKLPNVVYTYLNAYGTKGEWQYRPAFEQIVQAITGVQMEYVKGKKPKTLSVPILDLSAGLMGSYATLLGIYNQQMSGNGIFSNVHMTGIAMILLAYNFAKSQRQNALSTAQSRGYNVNYHPDHEIESAIFKTKDSYMCISGPKADLITWFMKNGLQPNLNATTEEFSSIVNKMRKIFQKRKCIELENDLKTSGLNKTIGIMPRFKVKNTLND